MTARPRFTLLGVGAAASPRYPPAGLLVEYRGARVVLDGGPGADVDGPLDAWLVTDQRAELIAAIRRMARALDVEPRTAEFHERGLRLSPRQVVHTSHPAFGYLIQAASRVVVWAPEFWSFPAWASGADLMFSDAAGWSRSIRFAGGVGGHMSALAVAEAARQHGVKRLVLAHLGRPTLRALDARERTPFGEVGVVGRTYRA